MKMREYKGKYIVYDDKQRVLIITRRKEIAINYAKREKGK